MLKGKELGRAIERAIQMKIDAGTSASKASVARDLGVEPNVVYAWIRTGSISKERLPDLWVYFSDVAGPDHWGISTLSADFFNRKQPAPESVWPFELTLLEDVLTLTPQQLRQLDHIMAGVLMGLRSKAPDETPIKSKRSGRSIA